MSRIKFYYVYRAYNKTSEVFFEDQQDAVDYASNFTAAVGIEIDPVMVFCNSQKTAHHDGEIEAGAAHLPESYDAPTSAPKLTCSPPMSPAGERAANKSQPQICPSCGEEIHYFSISDINKGACLKCQWVGQT